MRTNRPRRIGEAITDLIGDLGIREHVDAAAVVEAWAELAGPQINAVTRSVKFDKGILTVFLTRATWRQELHFRRSVWMEHLNEKLGRALVREVIFR